MFCTKCGNNNADAVKFCTSCGNALGKPAIKKAEPINEQEIVARQEVAQEKPQQQQYVQHPIAPPAQTTYANQLESLEIKKSKSPLKIIIVVLLLLIVGGSSGWWYYTQEQKKKYFVREYSALINGRKISFTLVRQGFVVSGNFISTNTKQPIPLKGTIDAQNNFTLYTENKREVYKGTLQGNTAMNGRMSKITGEDAIEINLTATGK